MNRNNLTLLRQRLGLRWPSTALEGWRPSKAPEGWRSPKPGGGPDGSWKPLSQAEELQVPIRGDRHLFEPRQ